MPKTATPRLRRVPRAAWVGCVAFALLGAVLMLTYVGDRALLARTARQVEGGRALSPEGRLTAYVQFANRSLRNPRYQDLPAGPVRLYYRLNPLHPGAGDVLRWGSDYRGACGSHSRVVVAMLESAGIPARHLQILNPRGQRIHTVVQAWIGGRWVVADALYGIVFHRRDGALATAEELSLDRPNFLAQVRHVPGYDSVLYDFDQVTSFNWNKIQVLLPAIRKVLVLLVGEQRVAEMTRPAIWAWPQQFYGVACLVVSAALLLLALWPGLRPAKPHSAT